MADFGNNYAILFPLDMVYDAIITCPDTVKVRVRMKFDTFWWKRILCKASYFLEDTFLNMLRLGSDELLGLRVNFDGIHHARILNTQLPLKILKTDSFGFFQRLKGILHIDFVLQCFN